MSGLNIPVMKKEADIKDLRLFVMRLSEEIERALEEQAEVPIPVSEALGAATRALFLSEEIKGLLKLSFGSGYISFGNVSLCFGSLKLSDGKSKAVALPVSYGGDYFIVLTPSGENCEGITLYSKSKQISGFTVASSSFTGEISADYITVGIRKGG